MQVIFLAYSNSQNDPLPTLEEEDRKAYGILSRRAEQLHFNIHRDSFATVDTIIEFLELYRKEIIVFSFSGHAGRDKLLLAGNEAQAKGIAGLLGQCPKLKLILLNGCATAGQVSRLLELPNRPVVIATNAPVGDYRATKFGASFFRELGERYGSVEEAFEVGLNAAKTVTEQPIDEERGVGLENEERQIRYAPWGIYANDKASLLWKLPVEPDSEIERKQTIAWLKWWGVYQVIGLGLLLLMVILQLPSSSFGVGLVPVFFFFAPLLPALLTRLNRKRLYLLTAFHASIYFPLLFIWMKGNNIHFFIYLLLGIGVYFIILPLINLRK